MMKYFYAKMQLWFVICTVTVLFLSLPLQVLAVVSNPTAVDEQDEAVYSRIKTYFAALPSFDHPCEELDLQWNSDIATAIGRIDSVRMEETRELAAKFKAQLARVVEFRATAEKATEESMLKAISAFRADHSGWSDKADEMFGSAMVAEDTWYMTVMDQVDAEDELRAIAVKYFEGFSLGFQSLSDNRQKNILDYFEKRAVCLQGARREVFDEMQRSNIELARLMGSSVRNRLGGGGNFDPSTLDELEQLSVYIKQTKNRLDYTWLAPESTQISAIYQKLAEARERSIRKSAYEPNLRGDMIMFPWLTPGKKIIGSAQTRNARLAISQLRARKALMALFSQEIGIEASITVQLEISAGLKNAWKELEKDLPVWWDEYMSYRDFGAGDDAYRRQGVHTVHGGVTNLAVQVGIGLRFLGSSFGTVVSPVARDIGDDFWQVLGRYVDVGKLVLASEKTYGQYVKKIKKHDKKIKLLRELADARSYDEQLRFVKFMHKPIPIRGDTALFTGGPYAALRSLLADPDFITATNGGLPKILAILCEDPKDLTAVYMRGAQYETIGVVFAATSRILVDRGLYDKPEDIPKRPIVASDLMLEIESPSDSLSDLDIPRFVRRLFEVQLSDLPGSQEDYLKFLDEVQAKTNEFVEELSRFGFELDHMRYARPDMRRLHDALRSHSFVYQTAYGNFIEEMWNRRIIYRSAMFYSSEKFNTKMAGEERKLTDLDMAHLTMGRDRETIDLKTRSAMNQVAYYALTLHYPMAAVQTEAFAKLLAVRDQAYGIKTDPALLASLEETKKSFDAQAVRSNMVRVWEGLLGTAIREIVLSSVSRFITGRILGQSSAEIIRELLRDTQNTRWIKVRNAFVPWFKLSSTSSILELMIRDAIVDPVKDSAVELVREKGLAAVLAGTTGASTATARDHMAEYRSRRRQGMFVDAAFEIAKDTVQDVTLEVIPKAGEKVVNWYTETTIYNDLLNTAVLSRNLLVEDLGKVDDNFRRLMEIERADSDDAAKVEKLQMESRLLLAETNDLLRDPSIRWSYDRYRTALDRLEDVSQSRDALRNRIENSWIWSFVGDNLKKAALDQLQNHSFSILNLGSPRLDPPGRILAAVELRSKLATKTHDLEDMERLIPRDDYLGLDDQALKAQLDIEVIRGALRTSLKNAADNAERQRVMAVAEAVDVRRITIIKGLLKKFMEDSPYAARYTGKVLGIVQGGASRENPESQGIFGDVDFTAFTAGGVDPGTLRELKKDIIDYFSESGYPLAQVGVASSMDTEVFVGPAKRMDSAHEPLENVIVNLVDQSNAPTGFYSEAGGKWANNNYFFSGTVLWGDKNPLQWEKAYVQDGQGLAVDMMRYFGKIIDPKYSPASIKTVGNITEKKKLLADVLGKGKVYLRLMDALLMSGSIGNDLYNKRENKSGRSGNDASYHRQIYLDADEAMKRNSEAFRTLFETGDSGRPGDLEVLRMLSEIKMKKRNPDLWSVLGSNESEQIRNAEYIVDRMRTLTPLVLARVWEVWHDKFNQAANSSDPAKRQDAFTRMHRVATTYKAMMDRDMRVPIPLVIPKYIATGDGRIRVLTEAEHARVIKQAMDGALNSTNSVQDEMSRIERIIDARPPEDIIGDMTSAKLVNSRARLKQALAGSGLTPETRDPILLESLAEQNLMRYWINLKFALSVQVRELE